MMGELTGKLAGAGVNLDLVYLATGPRLVLGAADLDALRAALRERAQFGNSSRWKAMPRALGALLPSRLRQRGWRSPRRRNQAGVDRREHEDHQQERQLGEHLDELRERPLQLAGDVEQAAVDQAGAGDP